MDVLRLDSNYIPDTLIEGYTSMIWTERNVENGEFEMKTPKIESTRTLLPEGTPVSLRDSKEVMITESHNIAVNDEGIPELTVKGRTFETFLENRALVAFIHGEPWVVARQYTTSEMVSLLLWNHLVNTTGEDPTRTDRVIDNLVAIPYLVITDSTTTSEAIKYWALESGIAYEYVRDFLTLGSLGVRAIRPSSTTGNVMTFDTTRTASRGTVSKVSTSNISNLRLDIYNGLDRTRHQSSREPVMFHYDSGHIDEPEYLFSSQNLKNMAVVNTSLGPINVWPDTMPAPNESVSGLSRRTLFVEGGKKSDDMAEADFRTSLTQKARIELKKFNRAILFDGAISEIAPYKYNTDYFLGDRVTLLAQYGFEASMIVSEYVRTEDLDGDRGYPGLSIVT